MVEFNFFSPRISQQSCFVGMFGALVERSTAALRGGGSIAARNKYFNGRQVVVPGVAVCVCEFKCLNTHPRPRSKA